MSARKKCCVSSRWGHRERQNKRQESQNRMNAAKRRMKLDLSSKSAKMWLKVPSCDDNLRSCWTKKKRQCWLFKEQLSMQTSTYVHSLPSRRFKVAVTFNVFTFGRPRFSADSCCRRVRPEKRGRGGLMKPQERCEYQFPAAV